MWDDVHVGDAKVVREVAVASVVRGEEAHRERAVSGQARWMEQQAAVLERRRKDAEEAARRERERVAELERKRIERLLGEAEALRNALAIRAYVEEVRTTALAVPQADLDAWAGWALEQADRIDPVLTGAFLRKPDEG